VHCLELWARLVSEHASADALKPLGYPVVQLLLAAARLVPTPRFLPLRLRLSRALNRIGQATGERALLAGGWGLQQAAQ
jgi:nucleolar complex protein 2